MSAAGAPGGPAKSAGSGAEQALRAFHEEGTLGQAYDLRLAARLWPFVRPYRTLVFLSVGLGFVNAGLALLRPHIMQVTIDDGAMAGDADVLFKGGAVFAGVLLVEQVFNFIQVYAVQISGARAMSDLRRHVFSFLQGRRLAFFDRQPVGRLVTRVTNDIDAILELFASGAFNAVVDLVKLLGIVVVMLTIDFRLALIGFAVAPLAAVLVAVVRQRSRGAFRAIRAKTAQMNANMNEQVSGMAVVQAFGREQAAAAEFDAINGDYLAANVKSIKYEALQDAAIEMVMAVCLASIVVSLGYHPVSFGTVVAFNAYLIMFFEPITTLAQRYTLLQSAMAGAERVFGLLDVNDPDAPRRASPSASPPDGSALSFEGVTFGYKPGLPVLTDISFAVRPGEKVAVVGPTGAGKSTLAALLLRLYDVDSGTVRVGGVDVAAYDRDELRGRFAVVPQDVFLFPGTIASNVAIGDATPDRARVEEALRRVEALEVFSRRPGGIDAPVGERGDNFSAGERQLIAFARALYRDARIIILDEATASIDSDTEARIQRALDQLMAGRTSLIIAHRLSTVRAADRILCLQRGRLVEQGTHVELVAKGGLYAKLHALHFARQGAESVAP